MRPQNFIGIDVQIRRGCAFYVIDQDADTLESGWVATDDLTRTSTRLAEVARRHGRQGGAITIGIDAPRRPLPEPRRHFWDATRSTWRPRRTSEKGYGRHCEVAIKALGIANPQWTRPLEASPDWMRLGYSIFNAMPVDAAVHEVFPSASYALLVDDRETRVALDFAGFARGPKDMLDACMAAVTVREFAMGRGFEIGGGDGLGSIILPRPPSPERRRDVLDWPLSVATI